MITTEVGQLTSKIWTHFLPFKEMMLSEYFQITPLTHHLFARLQVTVKIRKLFTTAPWLLTTKHQKSQIAHKFPFLPLGFFHSSCRHKARLTLTLKETLKDGQILFLLRHTHTVIVMTVAIFIQILFYKLNLVAINKITKLWLYYLQITKLQRSTRKNISYDHAAPKVWKNTLCDWKCITCLDLK